MKNKRPLLSQEIVAEKAKTSFFFSVGRHLFLMSLAGLLLLGCFTLNSGVALASYSEGVMDDGAVCVQLSQDFQRAYTNAVLDEDGHLSPGTVSNLARISADMEANGCTVPSFPPLG